MFYLPILMDIIMDEASEEDADDMRSDVSDENSDSNENQSAPEDDMIPSDPPEENPSPIHEQDVEVNSSSAASTVTTRSVDGGAAAGDKDDDRSSILSNTASKGAKHVTLPDNESIDDDGQTCTICFEQWTNTSEHRLVSLRCGHLFGRSCITRWIKGQRPRCPQCNARARKSEIRNIYAKAVKVLDSSERDKALLDLMKESEFRRKAEIDAAQERLKHMMVVQENERLKKELMEANLLLQEYRSCHKMNSSSNGSSQSTGSRSPSFILEKILDISKHGGARVVDASVLLGMILISTQSSNELFPGFGFRKVNIDEMKPAEFMLVHQKPIRDLAFHVNDGLVLTASLDRTLKITNVITNSIVQTYTLPADVWSCAWDEDEPIYFYGGLRTGEVYVFDIRMTSRHVTELVQFGSKTPVVSLQYLRRSESASHRKCGPLVGKLSDCGLYEKTANFESFTVVPLPSFGPFTSLSTEPVSGHFLVSCRPSPKQPRVNHTVCEFMQSATGDLVCNPVQTVLGGKTQVHLTRSKILSHPDKESSLLLCAGDEDSRGALIWDGSSGACLDRLPSDSPVLDCAGLKLNHNSLLATITDKTLRLYKWNTKYGL